MNNVIDAYDWEAEEWVAEVYLSGDGDTQPGWYRIHKGLLTRGAAMSWAAEARRHGDVSRERNVHG
jgi:hypothetical protein